MLIFCLIVNLGKKTPSFPDMLLLTLDSNNDYDEMLASQSISVFHVPPKDIKR
jgi:hypothetical protein